MKGQARSNEAHAARLRQEADELQGRARLQDLMVREEASGRVDKEG